MDMIRLDQLPAPPGAKKGRYVYVKNHPLPVWKEDGYDWWLLVKRAGVVVGVLAATVALVTQVIALF